MTIKPGTRVRVHAYEGEVATDTDMAGCVVIRRTERLSGESTFDYIHPDHFEVIKEPLRVGDVITADSPEPPIGTTLMDLNGVSARRNGNGRGGWGATWGSSASWEELRRHTWTVQHVGDGTQ